MGSGLMSTRKTDPSEQGPIVCSEISARDLSWYGGGSMASCTLRSCTDRLLKVGHGGQDTEKTYPRE